MRLGKLLNTKGQSIVEIALLTPLILVVLYIPADFGIALFTAHLTQNAAREGARIGSIQSPFDKPSIETQVTNRLPSTLKTPSVTASFHSAGLPDCAQWVRVTVSGNYNYFLYKVIGLLGFSPPTNTLPITRAADMRYAYQPATNHAPACN